MKRSMRRRPKKDQKFQVKTTREFMERLLDVADFLDRPVSQVIREAVAQYLAEMVRQHPELAETQKSALSNEKAA